MSNHQYSNSNSKKVIVLFKSLRQKKLRIISLCEKKTDGSLLSLINWSLAVFFFFTKAIVFIKFTTALGCHFLRT